MVTAGYSTKKDVFRTHTYSSQCNYIGITARLSKWDTGCGLDKYRPGLLRGAWNHIKDANTHQW